MALSPTRQKRLQRQGFVGLDDNLLNEIGPWTRFSTSLCAILMGIGTILASPSVLLVAMATALLGTILPFHPFDLLYNYGVRHMTGTRPLPPNPIQRRFACGIATLWLGGTFWAFSAGALIVGYVLGGILTAVALLVSTTDICIPSLVYGLMFGKLAGCNTEEGKARPAGRV